MLFQADHIAWQSAAGQRLDEFARRLPPEPPLEICVFGSAPLQLLIDPQFLSADIDLFGDEATYDLLLQFVEHQGWTQERSAQFYIQVCDPLAFKSTHDWRSRTIDVARHGHLLRLVHPWDVLVSKLQRLEEKDLNAFRLVLGKTGHPTEEEFARGDMLMNTRLLWQTLWGHDIDVRTRIIRPALERAEREYRAADPSLKTRLANLRLPDAPSGSGNS